MSSNTKLIWKIPLVLTGVVLGLVLLLLIIAAGVIVTPAARQAILTKGVEIANRQTDFDIDLGRLCLSPFHHSPAVLYRAYKGTDDLPLQVEIDSLFVGHRGQDTLLYTHALRLNAKLMTANKQAPFSDFLSIPIEVEQLRLDHTTFHSDSLIAAVGVDVVVGLLDVRSPELIIAEGKYPLHGLNLHNALVGIDLRNTSPDTTAQDTTPMLMAFDAPDAEMRNIHFRLTPMNMDIHTDALSANVLADVGTNLYDARRINIGGLGFSLGNLSIPADTIYGNACVNLAHNLITSSGLHVRSTQMGARADLQATEMNLGTMRVKVTGDAEYQGSKARLRASYDIDDEAYDAHVDIEKVNLAPFLKDSTPVVLAGEIDAHGKGIDPHSRAMKSKVNLHLTDALYDNINVSGLRLNATLANHAVEGTLHLPFSMRNKDLQMAAQTEHQFHVADFMTPEQIAVDYHTQMRNIKAQVAGEDFQAQQLEMHFATDSTTALELSTDGLAIDLASPMHVMQLVDEIQPLLNAVKDSAVLNALTSLQDLTLLDTLRHLIPDLTAHIALAKGSPVQSMIEQRGLDIDKIDLSLASDSLRTDLSASASIPEISHPEDSTALRLPAAKAAMRVAMTEGRTDASLTADSRLTDGAMTIYGLCTDAAFRLNLTREQNTLSGNGRLTLDSIFYQDAELGNRAIDLAVASSKEYTQALRVDVNTEDIPLDIIDGFVQLTDIALHGAVKAHAAVDGLPRQMDISAEVLPLGVHAEYTPFEVGLSLGETPIIMEHNHIDLNGLPVYGADSTFIALTGGLDLDSMRLNVVLDADSFAPVKLTKGGPIPVYGDLATDIHGSVTGPLDSIVADVDVTILPTTDITYPIDKKNLAQVKPYGTVSVRYNTADTTANALSLGGQINVDNGFLRYSPKAYPVMPFHVDSGSHIAFHGPIGRTQLAVSASQKVKADVQSEGEETRRVNFTTGVRVDGMVDSIGLKSIGFFLEAPDDEPITRELASLDEDTREGLAATLLATGMYVGESNVAAQKEGYALSSIINSRINAAMANSKLGKVVDIDFSSAQTEHAGGTTNDMNIAISKSFFKDRFRITIGSTLTDNPDVNKTSGLLSNLSAEYKLTKDGNVLLRAFAERDYNNVLEGELYKSGLGLRATKEWRRPELFRGDSITRTYNLTGDFGVAYRSNNSIGPDATLKSSVKNLMGRGETFTIKGNGAYYWALHNRHPGDPKKTDTYKLGANASLVFPYLHWTGDNNPDGDTRYMLGYQYENIAGGYGVHKISGSFTYFFHSDNSPYITHAFTPFSLSVVKMNAESDSLLNKAAEYPQLVKVIAGDEFVPAVSYNFIYNNYRSKRAVNSMFDLGFKESGNLINAIYCLFSHAWNEKDKPLGSITFNQFVKLTAELRNKFNLTDQVSIATRLYAGANIPLGNSLFAPLSEGFYAGGPNSMRSASPYAYGPGNFYSAKYNQNFFHAGDVKLEANFELRFPIVWKLYGAAFVDAGNVWNWYSTVDLYKAAGYEDYLTRLEIPETLYDGLYNNPELARQIALGTGAGLRLDLDGLVIRLDLGVAIHSPYQTFKYDKEGKPDMTQPIHTYFNIPSAIDAIRVNFGIGYPF
ncbi:MAG: translocation/assembly module TamB domain-containing protein [Paludibacteraceae bacterium]|nr:translocation/assembly module TamB domain-containing protein [Paludibacteraceae bacterium]